MGCKVLGIRKSEYVTKTQFFWTFPTKLTEKSKINYFQGEQHLHYKSSSW